MTSNDPALGEAARAQLNRSARRRGARVGKNVPLPGGGYESRLFSTWAPTVIAGIGDPPATIMDRAVPVDLKRKLSTETVKPLRERDGGDLAILKRKLARFVADNEDALRRIEPKPPLAVDNDRAKDMWDPLLAIADVAGGGWPERAREAGRRLVDASEERAAGTNVDLLLLGDIRDIFECCAPEDEPQRKNWRGPRLLTKRLLEELHALEERPWGAWGRAKKPMTGKALGDRLRPYGVRSQSIRDGDDGDGDDEPDGKGTKGYYLRAFRDAFGRYLPPSPPFKTAHGTMPGILEKSADFKTAHAESKCRFENRGNPRFSAGCAGVLFQKGGITEHEGCETGNDAPEDDSDEALDGRRMRL